jgi:hypothetical protein
MHNPFAPLIAIARRGISFTASHRPLPRLPRYPQSLGSRGQPQRPTPTLAGSRIQLKLRHLHTRIRIIAPPRPLRVTHLAKKALTMRLPISRRHLNSLKKRSLKPHDYEFHIPGADASPESRAPPVWRNQSLAPGPPAPRPLSGHPLPLPRG